MHLPPLSAGQQLRGVKWRGSWLPPPGVDRRVLNVLIAQVHQHVARALQSDFKLRWRQVRPIWIVCGARHTIRATLAELGLEQGAPETPAALYAAGLRIVFVGGDPGEQWFRSALVHEICHALCDSVGCLESRQPWAYEGYARFVGHQAAPNRLEHVLRCFSLVRNRFGAYATSLQRIVSADDSYRASGQCPPGSELVIRYLRHERPRLPQVWQVVRRALFGELLPGAPTIASLENAFGQTMAQIDRNFLAYCDQLAGSLGMPTRTPAVRPGLAGD